MSQQPEQLTVPPVDPGNPFLAPQQCAWSTVEQVTPAGPMLILTVRQGNTTFTAIMSREEAIGVGRQIVAAGQGISSLIRATSVPPPPKNGRRP